MFLDKIQNTIKKFSLLAKADKVIVGVSGGPDSVALCLALQKLKEAWNLKLYVAHLDHGLRAGSGKDVEFVRKLCRNLEIEFFSKKIEVRRFCPVGSLEEAARKARFEFFSALSKKLNADKLALGHNLDDQAETVLMRLIRGAGLSGLSAILPKRDINGLCVIRPLIETSRYEINGFLGKENAAYRSDPTNKEDIFLRNRIRKYLLPLLEKNYNKNIKAVLASLAQVSGQDYLFIEEEARNIFRTIARNKKNVVISLNLNKLKLLPVSLRRMVIRLSIAKVQGDTRRIEFRHLAEIEDLLINRPVLSIVHLPKGLEASKSKSGLDFSIR
mgnify:FL=1